MEENSYESVENHDEVLSNRTFFSRIAQNNFIEAKRWKEAFEGRPPYENYARNDPGAISDKVFERSVITIVFAQIALEAYISDYAFEKLDREEAMELTDEDQYIKDMWREIPSEATGNSLAGNQGFELLDDLKDLRNDIVHAENVHLTTDSSTSFSIRIGDYDRLPSFYYEEAEEALFALLQLPIDLRRIDSEICPYYDLELVYLEEEGVIEVEGRERRITDSIFSHIPY